VGRAPRAAPRPRITAAARDLDAAAQQRDRIVRLLRGNEAKPHLLCVAKKAVAVFRISRSSRSW
jgi:hypothetical protein